ncbi:MAG: DUF5615 family PIN-like protein, partial [Deltaproteobacteria bacterium]|nr:DUF5615 family PIN-like protein [Deltaproteobacteria bacterium]
MRGITGQGKLKLNIPIKIYTDASCNQRVVDILYKLGWDIETAKDAGLTGKIDDTIWVIHARSNHRISLTFDELSKKQGEDISRE